MLRVVSSVRSAVSEQGSFREAARRVKALLAASKVSSFLPKVPLRARVIFWNRVESVCN